MSLAYTATVADHYTDIASGWTQADFNKGASLTVKVAVTDGSTATPTCVSPSSYAGTTRDTKT